MLVYQRVIENRDIAPKGKTPTPPFPSLGFAEPRGNPWDFSLADHPMVSSPEFFRRSFGLPSSTEKKNEAFFSPLKMMVMATNNHYDIKGYVFNK